MRDAFICDGVRTPVGRYGGALSAVRTDDLAAVPLRALLARYPQLDLERIDDVIFGCANQAGEDNRNVARMSLLLAGVPQTVSGTTINRLCGSGLDAIGFAARTIKAGDGDLLIVDRAVEPYDGCIAVCYVDGEFTVKRVKLEAAGAWLLPSNPAYPPIRVDADNEFSIWGVVRHVVKTFK